MLSILVVPHLLQGITCFLNKLLWYGLTPHDCENLRPQLTCHACLLWFYKVDCNVKSRNLWPCLCWSLHSLVRPKCATCCVCASIYLFFWFESLVVGLVTYILNLGFSLIGHKIKYIMHLSGVLLIYLCLVLNLKWLIYLEHIVHSQCNTCLFGVCS